MKRLFPVAILFVFASTGLQSKPLRAELPNFVVILADDLGYGDLGCYGSQVNRTPHLDRLAAEGIRFTDFHSNGPMCTPTRAALLTGLYQQRFGRKFDGPLSGRTQRDEGLPLAAITIAEVLREAGYATGMFGKWHLGYRPPFVPTRHGFDVFRGLVSGDGDYHSHIDRSGNQDWWHNESIEMEEGYTTQLLTRHSVEFIERHKDDPFFLYLPHLAIHFPWQRPADPSHRVEGTDYWQDKWGIIPNPDDISPHVKGMVEALDQSVGEIIATLKRLGLEGQTFVLFASDNGGYRTYGNTHHHVSSNGPLRGQKGEVFEGGHRVPAIAWWPGRIRPRVCSQTVMTFDLYPTLLEIVNQRASRGHAPSLTDARRSGTKNTTLDGISLIPVLFRGETLPMRGLFWRMDDDHAVRQGPWKMVAVGDRAPMLFNLLDDIAEQRDLANQRPGLVAELSRAYARWEQNVTASLIR